MPSEEAEFDLTYYNTLTTWIDLDRLLTVFGLSREDLARELLERADLGAHGDEAQLAKASEVLLETRRALYRILAEEPDA